jgi:2-polyprenyl-3-methyl-5-hydroxy-6-metoxy-1,4-benzoquinol methylase
MDIWKQVAEKTNQHGYMSGVDRQSDRVKETGEVFTPTDLIIELCQQLLSKNPDSFAPGKTILDPTCGDGQFLVVSKWIKVFKHGMSEEGAVKDLYGVDIMRDNVDLCIRRLGGGNIVMGNTLQPTVKLEEQTDEEHRLMIDWFSEEESLESFFEV